MSDTPTLAWSAHNSDFLFGNYSNAIPNRSYTLEFFIEGVNPNDAPVRVDNQWFQSQDGTGLAVTTGLAHFVLNQTKRVNFFVRMYYHLPSPWVSSYIVPGWGFAQSPNYIPPNLTITPVVEGSSYITTTSNLIFNVRNNTASRVAVQLVGYTRERLSTRYTTFSTTPVTTQLSDNISYAGATLATVNGKTPGTEIPAVVILPPGESSLLATYWEPQLYLESNEEISPYLFAATLSDTATNPVGNIEGAEGTVTKLPSKIKYVNSGILLLGDLVSETCAITVIGETSLRLVVTNPISLPEYSYFEGGIRKSAYKIKIYNGSQLITTMDTITSTTKVGAIVTYDYILDSASITELNNLSAGTPVNFGITRGIGSGNLIADLVKFWNGSESGFIPPSISQKIDDITKAISAFALKLDVTLSGSTPQTISQKIDNIKKGLSALALKLDVTLT
jgi:hypothetical protein